MVDFIMRGLLSKDVLYNPLKVEPAYASCTSVLMWAVLLFLQSSSYQPHPTPIDLF
jgi:hypothetical protein